MHRRLMGILGLAFVASMLLPTVAAAYGKAFEFFPGRCHMYGGYAWNSGTCPDDTWRKNNMFSPDTVAKKFSCLGVGSVFYYGSISAPGVYYIKTTILGSASADLIAKLPSAAAMAPDTLVDSMQVTVISRAAGSITFGLKGVAQHFNASTVPIGDGPVSKLRFVVYPDSTSAKAETNPVNSGEMDFIGSSKVVFRGLFTSADFTAPATIGSDDFQVATVGGLQKTVTVPSGATAVVLIDLEPSSLGAVVPASNPALLGLLGMLLLAGSAWALSKRTRSRLS